MRAFPPDDDSQNNWLSLFRMQCLSIEATNKSTLNLNTALQHLTAVAKPSLAETLCKGSLPFSRHKSFCTQSITDPPVVKVGVKTVVLPSTEACRRIEGKVSLGHDESVRIGPG
jgi:hypothetical protein